MGKFLVRITSIITAIYFLICFYYAQNYGIDLLDYSYTILFELIVVIYAYSEGKYHCKYLKFTILSIFISDLITRLDLYFDILSVEQHNYIPAIIIAIGMSISVIKAFIHFYKVLKLKRYARR